jgi:hypothetical protein
MKTLAWLFAFGLGASTGTVINFDTAPPGKLPPGWTVAMTNRGGAPKWEILKDLSAPTQPYVLAQISNDPTGNRAPLAILDRMSLRDGDVSVRIKPVAGHDDAGGGLVWRYRDENNYYMARANVLEKSVTVYRVENGRRSQVLAMARHNIPINVWSILKVSARGNRFQVYVDHRRILQGQDNTFSGPGSVGLLTVGDSVTYFDDFRVYPK